MDWIKIYGTQVLMKKLKKSKVNLSFTEKAQTAQQHSDKILLGDRLKTVLPMLTISK